MSCRFLILFIEVSISFRLEFGESEWSGIGEVSLEKDDQCQDRDSRERYSSTLFTCEYLLSRVSIIHADLNLVLIISGAASVGRPVWRENDLRPI
jgi:hypothetical protein